MTVQNAHIPVPIMSKYVFNLISIHSKEMKIYRLFNSPQRWCIYIGYPAGLSVIMYLSKIPTINKKEEENKRGSKYNAH